MKRAWILLVFGCVLAVTGFAQATAKAVACKSGCCGENSQCCQGSADCCK